MTDLPMFTNRIGGPSVLTSDIAVYSAVILDTGDVHRPDIKFTRMDLTTFIKTELYRKDFTYFGTESQTCGFAGPPMMILAGMDTLYYLEYYSQSFAIRKFVLCKVDFIAEEITSVYEYTFTDFESIQINQLSNFMIVVKDEKTQDQYLVWDINKEKEFSGGYTAASVVEEELTSWITIDPCENVIEYKNRYNRYFDHFDRGLRGIDKIDLYIMKLFGDDTVEYFTAWENSANVNGYDSIQTIYLAPSPIVHTGKTDGITYLYLTYGFNTSVHPFITGVESPTLESPYLICTSINDYSVCPELNDIMYYDCWIAAINRKHKEMFHEIYSYRGNQFFTVLKVDIANKQALYKNIYNDRSVTYTYDDDCVTPVVDPITLNQIPDNIPWGCYTLEYPTDYYPPTTYSDYIAIIPGSRGLFTGGNHVASDDVWALRPIPFKTVIDNDSELLYIKVANPNGGSLYYNNITPRVDSEDYNWKQDVIDLQTMGLVSINIYDLEDYRIELVENFKDVFDLTMSKELAYRVALNIETNEIEIYRLGDGERVAVCGIHKYPSDAYPAFINNGKTTLYWEDMFYGMKLTQQPSTDENRLWKLVPSGDGGEKDTQMKLIGYNLEGGAEREVTIQAPFVFNNLAWYNIHMHDGKIILTTADASKTPYVIGVWVIK